MIRELLASEETHLPQRLRFEVLRPLLFVSTTAPRKDGDGELHGHTARPRAGAEDTLALDAAPSRGSGKGTEQKLDCLRSGCSWS